MAPRLSPRATAGIAMATLATSIRTGGTGWRDHLAWIVIAFTAPLLTSLAAGWRGCRPPACCPRVRRTICGTDELGRDVLARLLFGARISLITGIVVVTVGAAIGTVLGGIAAYAGGLVEEAIMRLTDLVLCFPPIILALAIGAALGIGTTNTIIAMLVVWWPKFARLARSLVLQQRSLEYVEAALVAGYGPGRILWRHIIPNSIGPLVVLVTLDVGNAIIIFAGLSFLGLGVVPPTAEWGSMISEGRELVAQWWVASFPGFAILSIVLGFNFLGDGVRDWLDPRSRRQ